MLSDRKWLMELSAPVLHPFLFAGLLLCDFAVISSTSEICFSASSVWVYDLLWTNGSESLLVPNLDPKKPMVFLFLPFPWQHGLVVIGRRQTDGKETWLNPACPAKILNGIQPRACKSQLCVSKMWAFYCLQVGLWACCMAWTTIL